MKPCVKAVFDDLFARYPRLSRISDELMQAFGLLKTTFHSGGHLFLCGNGGSAADCEHIQGELMKSFMLPRRLPEKDIDELAEIYGEFGFEDASPFGALQRALPCTSLTAHSALSTAVANDIDASLLFAQQLYALSKPGDALICLSTSGNAKNVLNAAIVAKQRGVRIIGMTGKSGGALKRLTDVCLRVPAASTPAVQEYHLPLYHAICAMLEEEFFRVG